MCVELHVPMESPTEHSRPRIQLFEPNDHPRSPLLLQPTYIENPRPSSMSTCMATELAWPREALRRCAQRVTASP